MNDLISRSALIAEYDRVHVGAPGGARKLMVDAPTVDAEPVRHGHWLEQDGTHFCSECGRDAAWVIDYLSPTKLSVKENVAPVCAYCGAKMEEEG